MWCNKTQFVQRKIALRSNVQGYGIDEALPIVSKIIDNTKIFIQAIKKALEGVFNGSLIKKHLIPKLVCFLNNFGIH